MHYVEALVASRTVNTLPPETFAAYRDHGRPAVRIQDGIAAAPARLKTLADVGIDLAGITRELELDGVAKFAASYPRSWPGSRPRPGRWSATDAAAPSENLAHLVDLHRDGTGILIGMGGAGVRTASRQASPSPPSSSG